MEHQFYVGHEVCCVLDTLWNDGNGWLSMDNDPKNGDILIITSIEVGQRDPNKLYLGFAEYTDTYNSLAFRPVVKTDISIFEAMLKPVQVDA